MPDLSTREQIRAEAIERIARCLYERERSICGVPGDLPWDRQADGWRDSWRGDAAGVVDALGDLLPTAMEGRFIGRGTARRTRYVTDWREPEETE